VAVFYPNLATLWLANQLKTDLASSKLKLFQSSYNASISSTFAELEAAEADFSGYTAKTITAWLNAIFNPAGGSSTQAPTQQFAFDSGSGSVTNNIGGWYLTTSTDQIVAIGTFDDPIPMAGDGDGIPVDILLRFGTGL
jgi:hypothetical protein